MTDSRHCPDCDRDLPLTAFGVNRHRKDGTMLTCRDCTNARRRAWYRIPGNKERAIAAKERWLRKRYGAPAAV